jgi:hypothetical protein
LQMQRYSLYILHTVYIVCIVVETIAEMQRSRQGATAAVVDVGRHSPMNIKYHLYTHIYIGSTGGCNVLHPTEAYGQEYVYPKQLLHSRQMSR